MTTKKPKTNGRERNSASQKASATQSDKEVNFISCGRYSPDDKVHVGTIEIPTEHATEWVKYAYELEEKRSQRLDAKANHLFLVSSILSAILLMSAPIILDNVKGYEIWVQLLLGLCILLLLIGMVCAIWSLKPSIDLDRSQNSELFGSFTQSKDNPNDVTWNNYQTDEKIVEQLFFLRAVKKQFNSRRVQPIIFSLSMILTVIFAIIMCAIVFIAFAYFTIIPGIFGVLILLGYGTYFITQIRKEVKQNR